MNPTNLAVLPSQYQQFIHLSRYARWDYDKKRRETWGETVDRYFTFFQEHLKETCDYDLGNGLIEELREDVLVVERNAFYAMFDDCWRCTQKRECRWL